MMIRLIVILFLVFGLHAAALADFDCGLVPGVWKGDRFEEELNAERTSVITLYADGRYRFEFHTFNEEMDDHSVDTGTWYCRDDRITFADTSSDGRLSGRVQTHQILELSESYFVFKVIAADCSLYVGDCENVVYGLTRESFRTEE